ncbi:MAG: carbamate kinase [Tidjanibacter sp.]|nr:carbamate kinase [Tidjanibacter sp.]
MKELVVVAFGGNALLRKGENLSYRQQLLNVEQICSQLSNMARTANLVIGHGNGPQVGNVLLQHEAGRQVFGLEAMPLDFCVAETQGALGYMIEHGMRNMVAKEGIDRRVTTLLTQVVVDAADPRFHNPTKPVGPFYSKEQAVVFTQKKGEVYHEDPKGRGWRKVVASPEPLEILNVELIRQLALEGNIVIAVGGGGVAVVREGNHYRGVEAVIDKDLALATTAVSIGADEFYILTDVSKVCLNFNTPREVQLDRITVEDAERYLAEGHFAEGSMAPKIRAAVRYVRGGGRECIITDATELGNPNCGTRITA